MGINKNNLRFLLLAMKKGVDFSKIAMIGRQTINMPEDHFLNLMKYESGLKTNNEELIKIYRHRYIEKLMLFLGAQQIDSFDNSDYENATFIHDFNSPIPEKFKEQYSLVIDGGSLEHIFNFPIAIANCMEMIEEKGHFISFSPANNYFGHGFYQFSPELFYRVLHPDNGYNVNFMYYYDDKFSPKWMQVVDPEKVHNRVTLLNSKPVMLALLAQRERSVHLFSVVPQQSDYLLAWTRKKSLNKSKKSFFFQIKSIFPITFKIWLDRKLNSKPNPKFFTKVDIVKLLQSN